MIISKNSVNIHDDNGWERANIQVPKVTELPEQKCFLGACQFQEAQQD